MPRIESYMWEDRPQTPGSPTRRISVHDRGGNIYKWDSTALDWTADTPNVPLLNASGDVAAGDLPATVLATQTIALAKVTGGGADGTATFVNGLLTAYLAPT